jgi:hypothetical protein
VIDEMNKLQKSAMAALAAGVLGATGLQSAAFAAEDPGAPSMAMHGSSDEARWSKPHADLQLNAGQEAAWKSFSAKTQRRRPESRPDGTAISKLSTPERLNKELVLSRERVHRQSPSVAAVTDYYSKPAPDRQKTFDAEYAPKHHRMERIRR